MSIFHNNVLAGRGAVAGGYEIERSLRFNSSDSAYLSKNFGSAGNRKTWTWAGWVKRSGLSGSTSFTLLSAISGGTYTELRFNNDFLGFQANNIAAPNEWLTNAVFRDASAWYHIVCAIDTTNATAVSRVKIYVNGVAQTFSQSPTVTQNSDLYINSAVSHSIGRRDSGSVYFNGYLADVHFIDGQALDPSSFGEFDTNGVWQPKAFSGGSYGTNGFHLPFSDNSTAAALGTDTSGNSNNWTPNNLSVSTGSVASPVRFTWSTAGSGWTLSNSNYTATSSLSTTYSPVTTAALDGGTTYRYVLRQTPADQPGGWFFADTTSVSNTHPDELGGNSLGMRVAESTIGAYGTFATANGTGGGQDQITGLSSLTSSSGNTTYSEWVVNMTARKVWVRNFGDSTWIKGGDPSNTSSTPTFSLPSGTIYFGYVGYNGSNIISLDTSVPSVVTGNDSLVDSPTNYGEDTGVGSEVRGNYATLNPLNKGASIVLSNGNLTVGDQSSSPTRTGVSGTIAVTSGKWYFEGTAGSSTGIYGIGVAGITADSSAVSVNPGQSYMNNGDRISNGGEVIGYGATYTTGDVIGVAYDADAGTVNWYKNNAAQGSVSFTPGVAVTPWVSDNSGTNSGTLFNVNFGQRPFAYTAPSGFKALCTTNLAEPTIADGSTAMDVALYTGNGSTQTISGLNFSPDLVWIKRRDNGVYQHCFSRYCKRRRLTPFFQRNIR
jgi:hypothetical protein